MTENKRAAETLRNQISTYVFEGTEAHAAIMLGAYYLDLVAALPEGEAERVLKAAAEQAAPKANPGAECACPGTRHHLQTCSAAIETALDDLECGDTQCWCFTRAAMLERPLCACANCQVWRKLHEARP